MTSLREDLLPLVEDLRHLTGDEELDQRTVRLIIRTTTWSLGQLGVGVPTHTDIVFPKHYHISQVHSRSLKQQEVFSGSGGIYRPGNHIRLWVTPEFKDDDGNTHGYTPAQLMPIAKEGQDVIYILTGALVGEYATNNEIQTRPYRYELMLVRRNKQTLRADEVAQIIAEADARAAAGAVAS